MAVEGHCFRASLWLKASLAKAQSQRAWWIRNRTISEALSTMGFFSLGASLMSIAVLWNHQGIIITVVAKTFWDNSAVNFVWYLTAVGQRCWEQQGPYLHKHIYYGDFSFFIVLFPLFSPFPTNSHCPNEFILLHGKGGKRGWSNTIRPWPLSANVGEGVLGVFHLFPYHQRATLCVPRLLKD